MRISRSVLSAVIVGGLALGVALPAGAGHSWNGFHWERSANPVALQLGNNVSGDWNAVLGDSATDWNASEVLDTAVASGRTNPATCSPTAGRVEVCSAAYGDNGWLGLAQVWISGSHIEQAIVAMNDTYFSTATYNDPNARRHVMCQELGHAFGLDHQKPPKAQSCMNDNWGLFHPSYTAPDAHDYEQLEAIYCHLDGGADCESGGGGKGGGKGNGKGPKSSGPQVSKRGDYTVLTWITRVR